MKYVPKLSLFFIVVLVLLAIVDMWFDVISFALFIKIAVTVGALIFVLLLIGSSDKNKN